MFASALLEELQLPSAIVPNVPANFSAWGMLMIDLRHDMVRAIGKTLGNVNPTQLRGECRNLEQIVHAVLDREGIDQQSRQLYSSLDMRYTGQGHTVSVPFEQTIDDEALTSRIYADFQSAYQNAYGYKMDLPADVVNLRIRGIGEIGKPKLRRLQEADGVSARLAVKGTRLVTDMIDGASGNYLIYERGNLLAGHQIDGPAIIEEPTTITPIRKGQRCCVDEYGHLVVTRL